MENKKTSGYIKAARHGGRMADSTLPTEWNPDGGRARLLRYCEKTALAYQTFTLPPLSLSLEPQTALRLSFRNGEKTREILVLDDEFAHRLVEHDCAQFEFLGNFEAVLSAQQRFIEALVDHPTAYNSTEAIKQIVIGGYYYGLWNLPAHKVGEGLPPEHIILKDERS